jgi:hypothetical protein
MPRDAAAQLGLRGRSTYRRLPLSERFGCVLSPPVGDYWCALRYAAITDAGTLPRSLTVRPVWRAQERSSALLGAPADSARLAVRDLGALFSPAPRRLRGLVLADRCFGLVDGSWVGLSAPGVFSTTTSVTSYSAPTTRSASSRGSLE